MSSASSDPKRDSNSNTAAGTSTIQLDTMSLDQLNTLKQREESRLQALSQRYSALRQAAARINAAKTAVRDLYNCDAAATKNKTMDDGRSDMKDDSDDPPTPTTKDVFVPLTESVYVPGKIRIRNNAPSQPHDDGDDETLLLIELGTGYFVEQNTTATTDYLQRKLNLVDANSDNVTQAIQATRQNMESIAITMRGKFIEIQARQQGQRTQQMESIVEEN